MIQIKRIYENPDKSDGVRVLIDRLWPRGKKKSQVPLEEWIKDLAPSNELRRSFGHDPTRWKEFKSAYQKELRRPAVQEKLIKLGKVAQKTTLTLLYSARDEIHNNAVVLKQALERKLRKT